MHRFFRLDSLTKPPTFKSYSQFIGDSKYKQCKDPTPSDYQRSIGHDSSDLPDFHFPFSGEIFLGTACGADPCMVAGHDKPCLWFVLVVPFSNKIFLPMTICELVKHNLVINQTLMCDTSKPTKKEWSNSTQPEFFFGMLISQQPNAHLFPIMRRQIFGGLRPITRSTRSFGNSRALVFADILAGHRGPKKLQISQETGILGARNFVPTIFFPPMRFLKAQP